VLKNSIMGREVVESRNGEVIVRIGGGENWHQWVLHCLEQDWGGVENLSLIPGSVGAAPIQNIGAYGVELQQVFVRLEALHLGSGELHTFEHADCQFGYRNSIFKQQAKGQYLITRVWLRLRNRNHQLHTHYGSIAAELKKAGIRQPTIRDISRVVCHIRRSKLPDPAELGNAGSFFKNPVVEPQQFEQLLAEYPNMPHYPQEEGGVKIPAGWLIEQTGWKGKRVGNCGVHAQQALVLVNYGGATGMEILQLSRRIQDSVRHQFGIELEREVNVL